MSSHINIVSVIGGMMLFILPVTVYGQEQNREQVLLDDIRRLGERAVRDKVISEDEHDRMTAFVRDSLPESKDLKVKTLEKIRDELDGQYEEMIRNARKMLEDAGYIGSDMLPDILYEPDDFVGNDEKMREMKAAAISASAIDKKELLKYVRPLPMKPWLMTTLRFFFGRGVSQRPQRWDYTVVPQMGGVYDIIMPGGQPDDSWRDAPKMVYDPHPDKHFRH